MARYFKNPPKRGKRRKSKKRRTAKQIAATRRLVALNKSRKRKKVRRNPPKKKSVKRRKAVTSRKAKRPRKSTKGGRKNMAARKKGRKTKGRRRSGNITLRRVKGRVYSSNPPFLRSIMQGGKDAAAVLAGGAAARTISNIVPLAKTGFVGIGVQVASAAVVGMAARRFVSGDIARMMVAGAMQVPLKALITQFAPGAAGLLGDYDMSSYLSGAQALYSSDGASALPESGVYVGEDAEGMNAYVDAY